MLRESTPFPFWQIKAGLLLTLACRVAAQNVVSYDFESGQVGGLNIRGGQVQVQTAAARSGQYGVRLENGDLGSDWIQLQSGATYKVQAWIRLVSETGSDWGGMRLELVDDHWISLAHSGEVEIARHGTQWIKWSLPFVASDRAIAILIGYFGGSAKTQVAYVDDIVIRAVSGSNSPPVIYNVLLTPSNAVAPTSQTFTVAADDPDGAVDHIVWEFGDGTRAFGWDGQRNVSIPSAYQGRITVIDEEGATATREFTWSATRAGWPQFASLTLSPTGPIVTNEEITITGQLSNAVAVAVSSDRGYYRYYASSNPWPVRVPLQPGWNLLLMQVHGATGQVGMAEHLVRRIFPGPLGVQFTGSLPATGERWEPLQILFHLQNCSATHLQFPYDPAPPGLHWLDGVTVDAVFRHESDALREWRRPAFLWQPYERAFRENEEWMHPTGAPVWCVRFAPPLDGQWTYRIEVQQAGSSAQSEWQTFTVYPPTSPQNRGPVRVSTRDPRYFEYADGSYFTGGGHGFGVGAEQFSYEAEDLFQQMGPTNQCFFRWWIAGIIWGSAWQPWSSRTISHEGTVPATGLTLDSAFANGLAAWRLDSNNPVLFQGFMSGHAGLIPGRTYRVRVRWRTEGITGPLVTNYPYGLCLKFVSWPEPGQTYALPVLVGPQAGDSPWHVAAGEFTATTHLLPNLAIIWENATGGRGYVDEVVVEEKLGAHSYGPNLLRSPFANSHLYFDPRRGACLEHILQRAQDYGMTFRLNIGEKQEYLLNRLSPQGLPDPRGEHYFDAQPGPVRFLHGAYWRHLFARYGAFRSVHSWETANEVPPGPGAPFALTAELQRAADADGNPHPACISTWASPAEAAWNSPDGRAISHVDFHCYVNATGWIEPKSELQRDSARFFHEYDLDARRAFTNRPIVWGEMGIDGLSGSDDQETRLAEDLEGIWLHKIVWARTGPGGVYPLYWYTDNIFNHRLHGLFGRWRRFMEPIPLTNGRYRDAHATASDSRIRVLGQIDLVAGRGHLWIDNSRHTWRAVVDGSNGPPLAGTITLVMDRANATYDCEWFNPYAGTVSHTQTLLSASDQRLTLTVSNLAQDVAVRIARHLTVAEQWRLEHFETTDNTGAAADQADPDEDGRPNWQERAFGTSPRHADRPYFRSGYAGTPPRLTLDYKRRAPPRDVSFSHAAADEVRGPWSESGLTIEMLESNATQETIRVRDAFPMSEQAQRFLRVRVTPN